MRTGDARRVLEVSGPLWAGTLAVERALGLNLAGRWPVRRVDAAALREQVRAVLTAWGMPAADAQTTSAHVVYADAHGIDSHGAAMLLHYHRARRAGTLAVPARVTTVEDGPATALLDGGGGLGHVPADVAMRMAVAKARNAGTATVAVRNSGHFGAAGAYAAMAAEEGMLGFALTTTREPAVVPTHGAESRLGTNALAFAAPSASGRGLVLDIATSTASLGKAVAAWRAGRRIPAGWAIDAKGRPVRNGRVAGAERRLTPLGSRPETASHKGYGLAAMVEVLARRLPGGEAPVGHCFVAIDPARFGHEPATFAQTLDAFGDELRATRPLDPREPVLVPGDPERRAAADRERHGIPLSRGVVEDLRLVARDAGVAFAL